MTYYRHNQLVRHLATHELKTHLEANGLTVVDVEANASKKIEEQ
jgi:hypothetical protein